MSIKLTCPQCNSDEVFKDGHILECDNCDYVSGKRKDSKPLLISKGRRIPKKPDLEYYDFYS